MLIILIALQVISLVISILSKNDKSVGKLIKYINLFIGLAAMIITKLYCVKVNIIDFPIAALISYALYLISLIIVGTRFNKDNILFGQIKSLYENLRAGFKRELLFTIFSSAIEELTYRGLIQYSIFLYTKNAVLSVMISCLYFSGIHYFKKMAFVQKIDIFIFSLFISMIFQITNDIWMVIIIHVLRNMFVILQKYSDYNTSQKRLQRITKIYKEKMKDEKAVQI